MNLMKKLSLMIAFGLTYMYGVAASDKTTLPVPIEPLRSERILEKFHRLEVSDTLLSLLITPRQAKQILSYLKKAQEKVSAIEVEEYQSLISIEQKVNQAVEESIKSKRTADPELLEQVHQLFERFQQKRLLVIQQNMQEISDHVVPIFESWQLNSIKNSATLPSNCGDKIQYFLKNVLLDKDAYEILQNIAVESNKELSREE